MKKKREQAPAGTGMTEQMAIRMSSATRLKLEQLARKEDRPVTSMARLLIERQLGLK